MSGSGRFWNSSSWMQGFHFRRFQVLDHDCESVKHVVVNHRIHWGEPIQPPSLVAILVVTEPASQSHPGPGSSYGCWERDAGKVSGRILAGSASLHCFCSAQHQDPFGEVSDPLRPVLMRWVTHWDPFDEVSDPLRPILMRWVTHWDPFDEVSDPLRPVWWGEWPTETFLMRWVTHWDLFDEVWPIWWSEWPIETHLMKWITYDL